LLEDCKPEKHCKEDVSVDQGTWYVEDQECDISKEADQWGLLIGVAAQAFISHNPTCYCSK